MSLSRNEDILKSILNKETYNGIPQSRIEELLVELGDMIKLGGSVTPEELRAIVYRYLFDESVPVLEVVGREEFDALKADFEEYKSSHP